MLVKAEMSICLCIRNINAANSHVALSLHDIIILKKYFISILCCFEQEQAFLRVRVCVYVCVCDAELIYNR